jgi:hypothetical protein
MTKKLIIALLIANSQLPIANSQSISRKVVSSAGGTLTGGSSMVTFTIGETVIPSLSAGGNIITQGFQQPGEQVRTGTVASAVCAGSTFSLPYTAIDIGGGNTFTAELSDATGSFASPDTIGTLAGNASNSNISVTIPANTTAGNGYRIRVVASAPNKVGTDNGTNIQIVETPTAIAGAAQEICAPNPVFLNGTSLGGSSYTWSTSGDGSFNNANIANAVYTPGNNDKTTGTVTLYLATTTAVGGCQSVPSPLAVTVRTTLPLQPSVVSGAPPSVCPPLNGVSLSVTPNANVTSYTWANAPGSNGISFNPVSTTNTQVIDIGTTTNSTYNIRVTAANACGSSLYRSVSIRRTVSTPAAITGTTVACAAQSYPYSIAPVTGADNYTWTAPAGASINGGGNTLTTAATSVNIQMPPVFTTGAISVTANVACFVSPSRTITVSASTAALNTIAGSAVACPGSTLNYTVPSVAGATSYQWTLPGFTSGSSSTNSINVTFNTGFTSSNLCVKATSVCGVQTVQRCKSVTTGLPAQPTAINGNSNGVCGQTVNYNCPPVTGATGYLWTLPAGTTGSSTSNAIAVTFPSVGFTTGNVTVQSQNSCGLSLPRTITAKGAPNTPAAITANPVAWCNNDPGITFTGILTGVTGAYNLVWNIVPSTAATIINGQGSNNLVVDWNTGNATVSFTTSNGCGNGTRNYNAVVSCREKGNTFVATNEGLNVFPNPTNSILNIEMMAENAEPVVLILTDISGKTVLRNILQTSEGLNISVLDLSGYAKGVYTLRFRSETLNKQIKVVLQ